MEVFKALYFLTLGGLSILLLQQIQLFLRSVICQRYFSRHITVLMHHTYVLNDVGDHFIGVTLGSTLIKRHWEKFNVKLKKMQTLAKGLSPSYIRVGGTDCDFLIFNMTQDTTLRFQPRLPAKEDYKNFTMTVEDWDKLNQFVTDVGWDLIFDFNVFLRKNGQWDPTNAIELLKYTVQKGYKPAGYELGNEPNAFYHKFHFRIPADLLAKYFATLNKTLSSFPQLGRPLIIGPDTTKMNKKETERYLSLFLESGGGETVDVATFHHYYLNSATASVDDFSSVKVLDSLKPQLTNGLDICHSKAPGKQCWLGETSSSWGGGTKGVSDRYVAGFLWLDKLGVSAVYGIQSVLRQSFYGGEYSLIDANLNPNPDYWLTLLYKQLVGGRVLNIAPSEKPDLRVYAHCTNVNSSMGYEMGDVTVYVINVGSVSLSIDITGIGGTSQHLYMLSPGDEDGLTSKFVRLNGEVLMLVNEDELPTLKPEVRPMGSIEVSGYNMGFIVISGAKLRDCL